MNVELHLTHASNWSRWGEGVLFCDLRSEVITRNEKTKLCRDDSDRSKVYIADMSILCP